MKRVRRAAQAVIGACLTAVLLCCACLIVFAADTTDLDLTEKGSVSLTLYSDEKHAAVTDGEITIYEVADLTLRDGSMAYINTDAFAGFAGELDIQNADLAGDLSAYVSTGGVTGTARAVTGDGISFTGLTPGLYLLVQTKPSTGYYAIDPILVTVPLAQDDVWVYHVDASPKVEVYAEPASKAEPEPEAEPEPKAGPEPAVSPGTDKTLPQTGQLFWPVPVLTGAGLMLIAAGNILRRKKRAA